MTGRHAGSAPDREFADAPRRFTSSGVAWREFGAGPALILLHGGAGSWLHWARNIEALATRFRVIAPDCPGFGDSGPVPDGTSDEGYLDLLQAAIDEMTPDEPRVHFAGFSFGGYLAAEMALRFRARTTALSMTGGAGFGPPEGRTFTLGSKRRLGARLGREPTGDELRAMDRENLALLMLWDADRIDDRAISMQRWNVAHTRFDSRRLSWAFGTPELIGRLACPVMVVYGEHDAAAIPPVAERFRLCRAARADVLAQAIPDCGHWAMYEAPEVFNRLMLDFHTRAQGAE